MKLIILSMALLALLYKDAECAGKCDMMKDFKAEFEDIKKWGEDQCKKRAGQDLSQSDIDSAHKCYEQHLQPQMSSDNAKKVCGFLDKKIFVKEILPVCHDKNVQKKIQSDATKDVGIPTAMKLKGEIEKNPACDPFKPAMQAFSKCVKAAAK